MRLRSICWLLLCSVSGFAQSDYYSTLEKLSEPVATRWQHFGPPYFSTNEKLLNLFYPRFDGVGGVTVGVSFQQNFSLLVHARPELCVIFDYNPGVTEVLVPFMGQVISAAPTRREFVSALLGADLTGQETRQLLEGEAPVATVLGKVLERTEPAKRQAAIERLREILRGKVLSRLPAEATIAMRADALKWIDILENEELLTGAFFTDAIAPYQLSGSPAEQQRLAGWLSTEENYALVRSYWLAGKVIGVTGDISGTSVAKLAQYLRDARLAATVFYVSNVGVSVEGHVPEKWFRDLYQTLGQVPAASDALTLVAHGPWQLTGYVRSLQQAQWVYGMLAEVPEQTAIRLHEAPLEIMTQQGVAKLLPAIRRGLAAIQAPKAYEELLIKIESKPEAIRFQTPAQFRKWARLAVPGVDVGSPVFRTIMVTLAEAGYLQEGS